jgi:hypothetical protein
MWQFGPLSLFQDDLISFCHVDDLCWFYHDKNVLDDIIQLYHNDGDEYNWEHMMG